MRLKTKIKRILAGALAVCMTFGGTPVSGNMIAQAATELDSTISPQSGSSRTTAYTWKTGMGASSEGNNITTNRFDLKGFQSTSQTDYNSAGIKTTYNMAGYATWISPTPSYNTAGAVKHTTSAATQHGEVMEINNTQLGKLELKIYAEPSDDNEYVWLNYDLYNPETVDKTVYLGTGADILLYDGAGDAAALMKTARGFYMRHPSLDYSFECITEANQDWTEQGITPTDTRWVGHYTDYWGNLYNESAVDSVAGIDSGFAYSWEINLRPLEVVHKRVAYAVRPKSYYVHQTLGNNSNQGTYDAPLKTIQAAVDKIGAGNMGYVYLMADYEMGNASSENQTIALGSSTTTDITFEKSVFNIDGSLNTQTVSIIRGSSFDKDLFSTVGAILRFKDITLDGNNVSTLDKTLISVANNGTLDLISKVNLIQGVTTGDTVGSAINVIGTGTMTMGGATIKDNVSGGKGAVYFGGGSYSVKGDISIQGNENSYSQEANVYLANGKHIVISDSTLTGEIGVTTEQIPAVGASVKVVDNAQSNVGGSIGVYASNFKADAGTASGMYLTVDSSDNIILKSDGLELAQNYVDNSGNSIAHLIDTSVAPGNGYSANKMVTAGAAIDEIVIPIDGYEYMGATLDPTSGHNLVVGMSGSDRKLTGTMPNQGVVATYQYKQIGSTIEFEPYGGSPQPVSLTGTAGSSVSGLMPMVARYGYTFDGWYKEANVSGVKQVSLPSTFPSTDLAYYAKWVVDTGVFFDYTVRYVNLTDTLTFQTSTTENTYHVGSPIAAQKKTVPGYNLAVRGVDPATAPDEFNTSVPVGNFDGADDFSGSMPDQATTVTYQYSVNPGTTFPFTVKHVSSGGVVISSSTVLKHAEDPIQAAPQSYYGYDYISGSAQMVSGGTASDVGNTIITGIVDTYGDDFDAAGALSSKMPNQAVELIYTYDSNGLGFEYRVEYQHAGADIVAAEVEGKETGAAVSASPKTIYGYLFSNAASTDPAGYGSFDGSYGYSANMPSDSLRVTYQYGKDAVKWKDITYLAGVNGSINNTGVANVQPSGANFKTNILIDDGITPGHETAYQWSYMKANQMVPNAVGAQYYQFDGWYLDTNGNGILDPGETQKLTDTDQFSGPTNVIAKFVEDPAWWIDIYYVAGSRGSISGVSTYHTTKDRTWGSIPASALPTTTPQVNYLFDGWYLDGQRVNSSDVLANGNTYEARFKKDPAIWGLDVDAPDAIGVVDVDGSGRINVFDTSAGYQYVITDLTGKIIAVKDGSDLSDMVSFPGLYPGTRYEVYEVGAGESVNVGGSISTIGDKSSPTEILIPVVDTNYTITYDENEDGKTKIVINPADPKADYALLDENGAVVMVPGSNGQGWVTPKGSNPSIVEFPGLDYDKEYTVVARPKGESSITPESKINDGTVLVTDPGGELQIPTYVIEAVNGTVEEVGDTSVGSSRYDEAKKGDEIKLSAAAQDGSGNNFLYWKVLIGGVDGLSGKITTRDLAFVMPDTNVVVAAYYDRVASSSNANVEDEVRGGNQNEMALDPNEVGDLEDLLTTDADRDLIDINNAKVTYKVIFDKNSAKAAELNVIKASSLYDTSHIRSFTDAWALDVKIERYVNGRKVGVASPSDATFNAYVQLDKEDIDMMDYQLYEIAPNGAGSYIESLVSMSDDPEQTGGLFSFTAQAGHRYILVYSKAYRVRFINKTEIEDQDYWFKVRKYESISDSEYSSEFGMVEEPEAEFLDSDGVYHIYEGWALKKLPERYREYDFDTEIKKPIVLYAYYKNNMKEVLDNRDELEDLLDELMDVADEYFLTKDETKEIKDAIKEAQDVFNKTAPKASLEELKDAIKELKKVLDYYKPLIKERHDKYQSMHESGGSSSAGGGGRGSGGGSGVGSSAKPYVPEKSNSYVVGVNGNWEMVDGTKQQWAFTLNGGVRLTSMWAWLKYEDGQVNKTGWYHFNSAGIMNDGWFRDEALNWYYCDTVHDGGFGLMKTGWHYDASDKHWYYLDPQTGMMVTGWREIGGQWYYFTAVNYANTYAYNAAEERWAFMEVSSRPLGSMYQAEGTPDGHQVSGNGEWIK